MGAPGRHQKTSIFRLGPKSTEELSQSTPGRSELVCWSIFMTFGVPFWLHFAFFSKKRKTMKSMPLTTFWKVFHLQKTLIFGWIFRNFSCFFQNPSRRAFLEGPGADLCSKVRFWRHFRFSVGPKIHPWTSIWHQNADFSLPGEVREHILGSSGTRLGIRNEPGIDFPRFWTAF